MYVIIIVIYHTPIGLRTSDGRERADFFACEKDQSALLALSCEKARKREREKENDQKERENGRKGVDRDNCVHACVSACMRSR